ncbi:MAG: 2-octaprenyl-6-methoxyphenyl hydroxylase [Gammaproteobacteria bacterium]
MASTPVSKQYDVIISGGGLVGASLACALAPLGKRIAIIEAESLGSNQQPSYDERVTAVAWGSRLIFQGMDLWQAMCDAATPIETVHISEAGRFGVTRLNASEFNVDALGYVIPNRIIGSALINKLQTASGVDWICPAKVVAFSTDEDKVTVTFRTDDDTKTLQAKLLVAADGARSRIRDQLGIKPRVWDYAQTALVTTVTPTRPHRNIAYERFTPQGPIAMLPLPDSRCGVVWTVRQDRVDEVTALDDAEFCYRLGQAFGSRLGRFERVGKRNHYPLYLVSTREQTHQRVVIVGNAAHNLHPIAGQGFNLSLRDVAVLADVIAEAGEDGGSEGMLKCYTDRRQVDQQRMIAFTDVLNRLFRNPLLPLGTLRSLGLLALDITPPLKRKLASYTMGLIDNLPHLARGKTLQ